jgi:hypothetical protein
MKPTRLRHRLAAAAPAAAGLAAVVASTLYATNVSGATVLSDGSTSTSAAPTPAPSSAAASCDRGPWGWRVQGTPAGFSGGDRGGDYLWHNTTGFHLRVTHRANERVVYSGVIHSSTAMSMDPVRLERGDVAKLSADHRTLVFAFANHGHVDGVNFHTACAARLTVSRLNAGSAKLPADRVYLGAWGVHPHQIPFTLHRIGAS